MGIRYFKIFRTALILLAPAILSSNTEIFASDFIPEYSTFRSGNGLEVILIENHRLPMIDVDLLIKTGSSSDPEELSGLAILSGDMLIEGAVNYPGASLMAAIDSVGGVLDASTKRDFISVNGNFMSRDIELALKILADIVIRPEFDDDNLERLKRQLISHQMQTQSTPANRILDDIYNLVYGNEGYGLPFIGTPSGMKRITMENVRSFYSNNVLPENSVLLIAGDFDKGRIRKLIKKHFAPWSAKGEPVAPVAVASVPESLKIIIIDDLYAVSSEFALGRAFPRIDSPDGAALVMLNYIFGSGGDVSRLSKHLIDEHKATEINSSVVWMNSGSILTVYGAATNEMAADAIRQLLDVMRQLRDIKVSARELEECKAFYRGDDPDEF